MQSPPRVVPLPASPLAVLRARDWAHFVALPLASARPDAFRGDRVAAGVAPMAVAALALGYAYGLNAISDRTTDADVRKNPLVGQSACPSTYLAAVGASGVMALLLAATLGRAPLAGAVVSIAAATLYSVGFRLKSLPFVGTLVNALIFSPLLALSLDQGFARRPAAFDLLAVTFSGLLLQNQLLHERADASEDAGGGVFTTIRALGESRTRAGVWLIGAATIATGAAVTPRTALLVLAFAAVVGSSASELWSLPPAEHRRVHRWISLAGGAALYVVARGLG